MIISTSEPQTTGLVSQLPTASQMRSEVYGRWLREIREENRFHRKQWEYIYILQALYEHDLLREGIKGLGFGVGSEMLPAVMASHGCSILATEINIEKPNEKGWVKNRSIEEQLNSLNNRVFAKKPDLRSLSPSAMSIWIISLQI